MAIGNSHNVEVLKAFETAQDSTFLQCCSARVSPFDF